MSPFTRFSCTVLTLGMLQCSLLSTVRAQFPQPSLPDLPADTAANPVVPQPIDGFDSENEPKEMERLRDAIQGKFNPGGSGDAVLDEIIDLLRREGSIVDRFPSDRLLDPRPSNSRASSDENATTRALVKRKAMAAEQLLRVARLLEQIGEIDADVTAAEASAAADAIATDPLAANPVTANPLTANSGEVGTAKFAPDVANEIDSDPNDLIRRMRAHAAKLLIE